MTKNLDKFSKSDEKLYEELYGFVKWLAHKNHNPNNVMMDSDDIAQELFIELFKGLDYYSSLPEEEKKAVLKKMIDNRLGALKFMHYRTHRGIGNNASSIDDDIIINTVKSEDDIEELFISSERVDELKSKLSPFANKVLEAIMYNNPRMEIVMKLAELRYENYVKNKGRQNVKVWYIPQPYHICDVLGESLDKVRDAFSEINKVWSEVCNG